VIALKVIIALVLLFAPIILLDYRRELGVVARRLSSFYAPPPATLKSFVLFEPLGSLERLVKSAVLGRKVKFLSQRVIK
jgi:hypothetical protein